jgi:phage host-nuclease inhibitor protein Gam
MSQSERPQARRIARKIEDYTGEVQQLESLQREIARLEAAQREQTARTQLEAERDAELQAMAYELSNILLEEEDAIQAILALEEFETRLMLAVVGIKLH